VAIAWYIAYYTYQINVGGPSESCDCLTKKILNGIFMLAIIGLTFSLYYHFCNGIRHLFWDIGKGFEVETARTNGYLVIALAVIFTVLTIGAAIYLKFF
jgi:succinate dehydrogenase cytochrome b556 subunit